MGQSSLKQLFQQEYSRLVAIISKSFGLQHMQTAEDIVGDTFLQAAETWGHQGLPPNPVAWLHLVARQKAIHHFRRKKTFEEKVKPAVKTAADVAEIPEFSPENIRDSQLQMLFAVCSPLIASEAQIALALRVLCGFGIEEIAEAFLVNKETINKRLFRAKEKLREAQVKLELPPEHEIVNRLGNVLHVIYLLFNEGYYSRTNNEVLQKDLCLEAMRLALLLTHYEKTNVPKTNALLALMCFHASRFEARIGSDDSIILYDKQDKSLWDDELIRQGNHFLNQAAQGNEVSTYHLEAGIAGWHCEKEDSVEKWQQILNLYNQLLHINYSPGAALNRIYALYKVAGAEAAIPAAEQLALTNTHFYFVLLGELYQHVDKAKAKQHLLQAQTMAKTKSEKDIIQQKIAALD